MLSMTLLAVLIAGCSDPQAAEHIRVRQAHDQVDALLSQAQLSYVPGDQPVEVRRADWRFDKQDQAIQELASVLQEGSSRQQVTTRRLLADLHDSSARQLVSQGISAWTAHANVSALLLSHLLSVDRADAQVRRFAGDQSKLLAQVRNQVTQLQRQQEGYQKELNQWQAKVKELTAQAASFNEQAQKDNAQASELRQQAFTATGQDRLKAYEQAANASIASNKAGSQAQQVEAQLDVAKSQAGLLNQRVTLMRQAVTQVQNQIKAIEASQAQQAQLHDKAQKDKQQAIDTLDAELTQVVAGYQEVADTYFTPALQKLDQAIELLTAALPLAQDNTLKQGVEMDLLARRVSKLHLLATQAEAAGDLTRKLEVIAQIASDDKRPGGALIPAKTTFYQTTLQSITTQRDQAIAQAQTTATQVTEQAASLAQQGDETIAQEAGELGNLARKYRDLAVASKN